MAFNRPSNWYSMDYAEQREWEDRERQHRADMESAEWERQRAEDDHRAEMRRAEARKRELAYERDCEAEANATLAEALRDWKARALKAEAFIIGRGLQDAFQATAMPEPDEEV